MQKVQIQDSGDTVFLEGQIIHKNEFIAENDNLYGKKVVESIGDSVNLKEGQIVSARELRDENSLLKREDKNLVVARDAVNATGTPTVSYTHLTLPTTEYV